MNASQLIAEQYRNGELVKRGFGEAFYIVSAYGMLGKGADETSKLQNIVDDANAKGRTAIFFPHGTYYVTGITGDESMHYFGDNATFIGGYERKITQIGSTQSILEVNVKDNGAKGDGVTDDTAAIQQTIDTVSGAGGGIVLLPKGIYIVSTLQMKSNVILMGVGNGSELKHKSGSSTTILTALSQSNLSVTNLKINGNKSGQTNGTGLEVMMLTSCSHVYIEKVTVTNSYFGSGIVVISSDNVKIINNRLLGLGGNGIIFLDTKYLWIMNNIIESCDLRGIISAGAVESGSMYIQIVENKIYLCKLDGIRIDYVTTATSYLYTVKEIEMTGNLIINNLSHGITVRGESMQITGNKVIGNVGQGIVIQGNDSVISNNIIKDNTGSGIDLGNCVRSSVVSNLIKNNDGLGVECNSSEDVVINANLIIGNSRVVLPGGTGEYYASGVLVHQDGVSASETLDYWKWSGNSTRVVISNNKISRSNANQKYGITLKENTSEIIVTGNHMKQSGANYDFNPLTNSYIEQNNIMFLSNVVDVVLPSASYIFIRNEVSYFKVSGNTTINGFLNLNSPALFPYGKRLTLQIQVNVTFNHTTTASGNLFLAGKVNFAATGGTIIEFVWDGTFWIEISRSLK